MSRSHDEGAIAVVFAIVLVVLVGISALAVDGGYWYTSQQQLQSAADSAALAGCRELALDVPNDEIWAAVEDYAVRNFRDPLDVADCSVVSPSPGGMSDITDQYVKVTVESQSPSFLSRVVHGFERTTIRAQAVARIGYLAAAGSPTPWGLNVMRVGEMSATMGGVTAGLWDQGGGLWSGAFSAGLAGAVTLRATNSTGYLKDFPGLVRVGSIPSGGMIQSVHVPRTTFTSGVDGSCFIEVSVNTTLAPTDKVTASIGNVTRVLASTPATGTFAGSVPVPQTSDAFITVPITVEVQKDKVAEKVSAAILVRRANFLLQDVLVEPLFARLDDAVSISVQMLEFEYGESYQLKVEGGAGEAGNFQALDFESLDHSLCGEEGPEGGYSGGANYNDWIVGTPGLVIHLEDLVTTLPGDKIGPTQSGINARLAGESLLTFAQWESMVPPPDSKQLFIIPICEQVEDSLGRSVYKIVSFATFFLEQPPSGSQDPVVGRFVKYTAPGMVVVNEPPYGLVVEAVHLDSRELDF